MRRPSHREELLPPPRPPFSLRRMVLEDLDAVMAIQRASFKNPWSVDLFKRELTHDWSTILLAEENCADGTVQLVGFLIFWLVHDEVHILNVATAPTHRQRGVARMLIDAALEKGRSKACTLATLEVRRGNEAALNLYKAFGFRPVGIRPNYYVDEGEDAIVMVLDL
ncbi:MAG: ribosomal protein S18-alanine N-acetyltransferase [Myxococcaceae bacterium]